MPFALIVVVSVTRSCVAQRTSDRSVRFWIDFMVKTNRCQIPPSVTLRKVRHRTWRMRGGAAHRPGGPALTEYVEMQTSSPSGRCTPLCEDAPISRRDLSKNETRCSCDWDTYRFAAFSEYRNITPATTGAPRSESPEIAHRPIVWKVVAYGAISANPFSSNARCQESAVSANRSSRSTPRNDYVRVTSTR